MNIIKGTMKRGKMKKLIRQCDRLIKNYGLRCQLRGSEVEILLINDLI